MIGPRGLVLRDYSDYQQEFDLTSVFKDVAAYAVVLAMLMFKPNGLFGENLRKKV